MQDIVVVGDIHAKPTNLEETDRLINWISTIEPSLPIVFLGDQLDTFGVARVEVINYWIKALGRLLESRTGHIYFLVGNHDMNHAGTHNFIDLFGIDPRITIVDSPMVLGDMFMMPFVRDNAIFTQQINQSTAKVALCHQEFNGAMFENGFYAPHGVDLETITTKSWVISGHIHEKQHLGEKVFYPGTPRPLTKSDANKVKGIHIINLDTRQSKFVETPTEVSKPFRLITVNESTDLTELKVHLKDGERLYVNIEGSTEFIQKILRLKDIKKAKVTTDYTDSVTGQEATIKESEGVGKAFDKYAISYFDKNSLGAVEIKAIMNQVTRYCPSLTTK